ncbi:MAG: AAA family ATPase, partial [Prevotellaceae bacterium]|nr:AAA family ATPase [Prevotellaceae bacterium]
MQATPRKYPIGIQDFEDLRTTNCVYVDKTDLVYSLVDNYRTCFLSRPRRFGKSLLLSTLKAYFLGKKELFNGLAIEQLETEWTPREVLYISFAGSRYHSIEGLHSLLLRHLSVWEKKYGRTEGDNTYEGRFGGVIKRAYEQSGKQVAVLIDEYDSPLLSAIGVGMETRHTELHNILSDFFSPLKDSGVYIRLLFITGITKFSQLGIFSELNHLKNISMLPEYSHICGITETELLTQFKPDIAALAENNHETYDEACAHLKQMYDGYHFCEETEEIYNPYSIINVLSDRKYNNYWYSTGTPSFLIEMLKEQNVIPTTLEGCQAVAGDFDTPVETLTDLIPVLYQSGYLTIKGYEDGIYTLGYPNEEV